MNVGLLLITHNRLGTQLLQTAMSILGETPINIAAIDVPGDCNPEEVLQQATATCEQLDQGGGVLILTDLYGSTPSNIAARLLDDHNVVIISGANVPMLIRILNYPSCTLEELGNRALTGAREGVVITASQPVS
ncbi:MAG: PTS sugar transporter subunit IIA [Gammaproteobacteria bacterium]|jgi:PTS system ascorbate-specific IIA component